MEIPRLAPDQRQESGVFPPVHKSCGVVSSNALVGLLERGVDELRDARAPLFGRSVARRASKKSCGLTVNAAPFEWLMFNRRPRSDAPSVPKNKANFADRCARSARTDLALCVRPCRCKTVLVPRANAGSPACRTTVFGSADPVTSRTCFFDYPQAQGITLCISDRRPRKRRGNSAA